MQKPQSLTTIFNDPTYAWELLEWQIAIEMNDNVNGLVIAKLLELYMRGVEKMNSIMDVRESYFKNKVTSLMSRGNVIKSLNKPPMAKKEKPLEVPAQSVNTPAKKKENKKISQKQKQQELVKASLMSPTITNTFGLQQKKKEIQMRLAYEAGQSSPQNLKKLLQQQSAKQQKINNAISNIINDHQERLKERINRRKLKTATFRSRPDDTNDTTIKLINGVEDMNIKRQQQSFLPPLSVVFAKEKKKNLEKRTHRSLQIRLKQQVSDLESPKKSRKYTFDFTQKAKIQKGETSKQMFKKEGVIQ